MQDLLYYKHSYLDPHKYKLYEFKNAILDSSRHVIMKADGGVNSEAVAYKIQALAYDKYMLGFEAELNPENAIHTDVDTALYIPVYTNFYHTMIDGLPRLWGNSNHNLNVVMSDMIMSFKGLHGVVLELIDPSLLKVYKVKTAINMYSSVNRLRAKSIHIYSSDSSDSRLYNRRLAVAFWQSYADSRWRPSTHSRKLYVPRTSGRDIRCKNQDEIFKHLSKNYGFEMWNTDEHSFNESARAFRDASTIVGVHGAAMSHVCFCRPGSNVYQLSGNHKSEMYYKYLCDVGNVRCSSIYGRLSNGQIAKSNSRVEFTVPLESIDKALKG